jgi:hypothetical protein
VPGQPASGSAAAGQWSAGQQAAPAQAPGSAVGQWPSGQQAAAGQQVAPGQGVSGSAGQWHGGQQGGPGAAAGQWPGSQHGAAAQWSAGQPAATGAVGQPWGAAPWGAAQPAVRRPAAWRRKRVWVPVLVVLLLVIGLVVWAPWVAPAVPGNVRATATSATSVRLDWDKSGGHTGAGKYSVSRDGQQVGEVGGDQTTFTDQGLRPGQSYTYSVKAKSWLSESGQAPDAKVRLLAPSPPKPSSGGVSSNAVVLTWAAPANSPAPDSYQVIRNGAPVQTLDAKTTTYRDNGLGPATPYRYRVVAKWGENASDPSEEITVRTATPPLTAARLEASSHEVHLTVTGVSAITNLPRGTSWTELWDLTPVCGSGSCDVRLAGELSPPGFRPGSFNSTLRRRGTLYTGTATARLSDCGTIQATDALTIRLTVRTAKADGNKWVASSWSGTVTVNSPRIEAGGGSFCPAGRIDNAVAG